MTDTVDVLYNGRCPICSAEIAHYRAYSERHDLPIRFHDLNEADLADWQVDRDTASRRLYVRDDGRIKAGIDAFLTLWRVMPRYRPLARIAGAPGIRPVASALYEKVLAPLLYRMHLRREARRQEAA